MIFINYNVFKCDNHTDLASVDSGTMISSSIRMDFFFHAAFWNRMVDA